MLNWSTFTLLICVELHAEPFLTFLACCSQHERVHKFFIYDIIGLNAFYNLNRIFREISSTIFASHEHENDLHLMMMKKFKTPIK